MPTVIDASQGRYLCTGCKQRVLFIARVWVHADPYSAAYDHIVADVIQDASS